MFGTAEFSAPEVVTFDEIGYFTDMWSIGVICYVLWVSWMGIDHLKMIAFCSRCSVLIPQLQCDRKSFLFDSDFLFSFSVCAMKMSSQVYRLGRDTRMRSLAQLVCFVEVFFISFSYKHFRSKGYCVAFSFSVFINDRRTLRSSWRRRCRESARLRSRCYCFESLHCVGNKLADILD